MAAAALAAGAAVPTALPVSAAEPPAAITFSSPGNPILGDGTYYTADAAPLVVGDTLYIYAGHDEAAPQQAGFEMHDYGVFSTQDVAGGTWTLQKDALVPGEVFSWATGNNAYAGQAVAGPDGRYYWYVPVQSKDTSAPNPMSIGVAVSDTPVGPWSDAIGSPLLTWTDVFGTSTNGQEVIDPAIFTDDDGTVYLHWGSWGVARAVELDASMTRTVGPISTMAGLDGFYEAPWVFQRNGIYYMVYDWKVGGSSCTPSNYQACIAYATADNPLGPWTSRGIILGGTSATTVHPSIIEFQDKWYITYHTKDAVGGGHFRRSVAIDEVTWDGDTIRPVTRTLAQDPRFALTDNVAPAARPAASFTEQPPMRLGALNDGRALTALLPPDQWGNFRGTDNLRESDWVSYQWDAPVRVDGAGIQFHEDPNGIRPPASWEIEYLDADGDWTPVSGAQYPTATGRWNELSFDPVTTTSLRATFAGRPEGAKYHSVSVSEWEVYAVTPAAPEPVSVATKPGTAPALPEAVRLSDPSGGSVWAPVNWRPVDAASYAQAGTFSVEGRVLGYAAAMLTAQVVVDPDASTPVPADDTAPVATLSLSGTSGKDGWFSSSVTARVSAEDEIDYRTAISTRIGSDGTWSITPQARFVDVPVTGQGTSEVSGRATDAAGNTSAVVSRTVKIDTVAPQATAAADATTRAVSITGSDALSGLDAVQYRFDAAGEWQSTTSGAVVPAPDGLPHTLIYRVTDLAGNTTSGTVVVPPAAGAALTGNIAGYATASASFTSGWEQVNGLKDGTAGVLEQAPDELGARWGTWPQVGAQWARLDWPFDATVDEIGVWWFQDSPDSAGGGMIAPRTWVLQYLDADGTTWRDVTPIGGTSYDRTRDTFVPVQFAPVTTRSLRIQAQAWGAAEGQGSIGIHEWQVIAAEETGQPDTTAPVASVAVTPAAPTGNDGWWTAPVQVTATATDDLDPAPAVEIDSGSGWVASTGPVTVGEGTSTVQARATDAAGNVSEMAAVTVKVDATVPTVTSTVVGRTVTVLGTDAGSGVTSTEYRWGQGSWMPSTGPVTAPGSGAATLSFRATDAAGNVSAVGTAEVPVSAGTASVELRSNGVLSAAGWYDQPVLVTVAPPAGMAAQYRINDGPWVRYRSPFTVSTNGDNAVRTRLWRDNAAVDGSESVTQVRVDNRAPVATATRNPASGAGTPRNPITLSVSATDVTAGVDRTEYRVDGGEWAAVSAPVVFDQVGTFLVSSRAVDRAGNVSAVRSSTVVIRADVPTSVKATATRVAAGGFTTLVIAGFDRWDSLTVASGELALGPVSSDVNGAARKTVQIPAGTAKGAFPVTVTGTDGTTATVTLTITG
nr:family 43 glycosylhydrolase [Nakamurella flavida]